MAQNGMPLNENGRGSIWNLPFFADPRIKMTWASSGEDQRHRFDNQTHIGAAELQFLKCAALHKDIAEPAELLGCEIVQTVVYTLKSCNSVLVQFMATRKLRYLDTMAS